MSVLKIELKKEHLLLLKYLNWSLNNNKISNAIYDGDDEIIPPFGQDNLYEGIDLVLNGIPADFDPFKTEEPKEYSDEQKLEWDKLYSELPLALEVILQRQSFGLGTFKSKYHDRTWKQVK